MNFDLCASNLAYSSFVPNSRESKPRDMRITFTSLTHGAMCIAAIYIIAYCLCPCFKPEGKGNKNN